MPIPVTQILLPEHSGIRISVAPHAKVWYAVRAEVNCPVSRRIAIWAGTTIPATLVAGDNVLGNGINPVARPNPRGDGETIRADIDGQRRTGALGITRRPIQ